MNSACQGLKPYNPRAEQILYKFPIEIDKRRNTEQIQEYSAGEVGAVYLGWDREVRDCGLWLRDLFFETAKNTPGIGEIDETLEWNQPAYQIHKPEIRSIVRIGETRDGGHIGLYFHCEPWLFRIFRSYYSNQLVFRRHRTIIIDPKNRPEIFVISHCFAMVLCSHLDSQNPEIGLLRAGN